MQLCRRCSPASPLAEASIRALKDCQWALRVSPWVETSSALSSWPCPAASEIWTSAASLGAWKNWTYPACGACGACCWAMPSMNIWVNMPCHRTWKAWLLAISSTKAWSKWVYQRPWRVWPLAATSINPYRQGLVLSWLGRSIDRPNYQWQNIMYPALKK